LVQPIGEAISARRVLLYDLIPVDGDGPRDVELMGLDEVIAWARRAEFERYYEAAKQDRSRVADIQEDYLRRSFAVILARYDEALFELDAELDRGSSGTEGRIRKAELAKAQVEEKRDQRLAETQRGRNVKRGPVNVMATALIVPPGSKDRRDETPEDAAKRSSTDIEQIAIEVSTRYEQEDRAADIVKSVESDNVGFDLLSLKGIERRCIEVKGRAGIGNVELTWSEFAKAIELGDDYWLYVVLDCASASPRLYRVKNPAVALAQAWTSNLDVRYQVDPEPVIDAAENPA
jgi:hypothetical protein